MLGLVPEKKKFTDFHFLRVKIFDTPAYQLGKYNDNTLKCQNFNFLISHFQIHLQVL